jgi:diguanylate cyclase (GGDEF)-like protein/PAS domain S-box-containing protein
MSGEDEVSFQFLAENSIDVICRAGVNLALFYASPSSIHVLGWKPEEMIGKSPDFFVLSEDLPALKALAAGIYSADLNSAKANLRVRKRDGSTAWVEMIYRLVRGIEGEPKETVIIMRDITERKTLEEQLSALALVDSLTGLSTERAFDEALESEWKRTLREGSEISLLLLDFHQFRQFHDQYGHQEGDSCLRTVSVAVNESLRATDLAARYGKEEIAVILPRTDSSGATKVAEKVRSAVESLRSAPHRNPESKNRVMVSIGIATVLARSGGPARMPEILLLAADFALYRAKHQIRTPVATALLASPKEG